MCSQKIAQVHPNGATSGRIPQKTLVPANTTSKRLSMMSSTATTAAIPSTANSKRTNSIRFRRAKESTSMKFPSILDILTGLDLDTTMSTHRPSSQPTIQLFFHQLSETTNDTQRNSMGIIIGVAWDDTMSQMRISTT